MTLRQAAGASPLGGFNSTPLNVRGLIFEEPPPTGGTLSDTVQYLSLTAPVVQHFDPNDGTNTPFEVITCTNWLFFAEGLQQITTAAMSGQIQRRRCYLVLSPTFDRSTSINSPTYTYYPTSPYVISGAAGLTGQGSFSITPRTPAPPVANYIFQGRAVVDLPTQPQPAGAVFTNLRLLTNLTTPTTGVTFSNTVGAALWYGVQFSGLSNIGTATDLTIIASISVQNAP